MRLIVKYPRVAFVILLITMMHVGYSKAAVNHNLFWGIEVGDKINYHLAIRYTELSSNVDLDFYVVLDLLPTISENLTELPRVTASSASEWNTYFSFYFMNGTEITPQTSCPTLHWSAYPLGNWSYVEGCVISDLNTTYWNVEQIDSETDWGLAISVDEGNAVHTDTIRYSREDGAMNFLEMHWQYDPWRFRTISYTRMDDSVPLEMIIGISILVVGIVAVVGIWFKRRGIG